MTRRRIVTIVFIGLLICGGVLGIWASLISGSNTAENGYEAAREFRVDFPTILDPTGNPTFELSTSLPDADDVMMIQKVKQPNISVNTVTDIGSRLGFVGPTIDLHGKALLMANEGTELIVWLNAGAIEYNNGDIVFPKEAPNLPSNEEVKRMATEFLTKAGLLPSDAIIQEPVPGAAYSGPVESTTGEIVSESYVAHLLVRFDRYIDGIPVTGTTQLSVRVGNNGEIGRILKVWRELEPNRQTTIKSPEKALQELKDGKSTHDASVDCERVVLKRIYLAYWMEAASVEQEYVVPVYVFEGESLSQNGEYLGDFHGYCNAV